MKIIHYINQFYAQIGGEEKADTPLSVRENRHDWSGGGA